MNTKYDYNFSVLTKENDISHYLLGAFITDGCVYKNSRTTYACQLSSCDQEWLSIIKNIIGNNLKLHKYKENYYGIRIIRNNIAKWFISHGCHPQKTLTVDLPQISNKYMPDFLRGCIDGDGSIGTYQNTNGTKRVISLISSSKIFLEKIQIYLSENNIKSSIIEKKQIKPSVINDKLVIQKHPCYNLSCYGLNAYKFVKLIYYKNNNLSMPRKQKLANVIIDFYETSEIIDKRKIPKFNKGCKIHWPEDQKLLEMINNSNIEKIAKELQIHSSSIRNRLKRRNLYNQVIKYQKVNISLSNEELISLLTTCNYNILELSRNININYKTLRKKLKERNLI